VLLRFLLVLLAFWVVLTLIGAVVKGLFWLAVIGFLLFLGTAVLGAARRR
jgi:hypothetical protein